MKAMRRLCLPVEAKLSVIEKRKRELEKVNELLVTIKYRLDPEPVVPAMKSW